MCVSVGGGRSRNDPISGSSALQALDEMKQLVRTLLIQTAQVSFLLAAPGTSGTRAK